MMKTLPSSAALILIDLQKAIDDPSWGKRNNPDAEANVRRLLERWRSTSRPVAHIRHVSRFPDSTYRDGQRGVEFKDAALPRGAEPVFTKSCASAFIGTTLSTWLQAEGIHDLIIAGVITNNSVEATARTAGDLGFQTIVVSDATFTFGRADHQGRQHTADEVHAMSLANLEGEYATICTSEQVLEMAGTESSPHEREGAGTGFYDFVAPEYAAKFYRELDAKPFDRMILSRLAKDPGAGGLLCDIGCGPGEVAAYLHSIGCEVIGVDLSPGMIAEARRLSPDVTFQCEDMLALSFPDEHFSGIAAFYAIVHCSARDLERAFSEWRRILKKGGLLLLSFHVGTSRMHLDEFLGKKVSADFLFFEPDFILAKVHQAGFAVEDVCIRYPYPDVEYPSKRCYLLARA